MSITSASMLVDLNLSVWTGNKVDKDVSRKVATDSNASREAGQFRKNLMAGTGKRKEIADFAARCRKWHNDMTLPWADRGSRLLPSSLFIEYKSELNRCKDTFDLLVEDFINLYPTLVHTSQQHLGDLFKPEDYPSQEEVASKFGFRVVFSPLPDSGDFRLDIPTQDLENMRMDYEAAFSSRLEDAMREPWEKLHTILSDMSNKLQKAIDQDGEGMRWHDTFITNAQDMCGMLTHLNLTSDPKLESARRDLERAIAGVGIDDIKEDPTVRNEVKAKLDNIVSSYEW